LGLFLLVLGALILPLFGISLGAFFTNGNNNSGGFNGYSYDQTGFTGGSGSGASGSERYGNTFTSFAKRLRTQNIFVIIA
jgi:hypothetical protein